MSGITGYIQVKSQILANVTFSKKDLALIYSHNYIFSHKNKRLKKKKKTVHRIYYSVRIKNPEYTSFEG